MSRWPVGWYKAYIVGHVDICRSGEGGRAAPTRKSSSTPSATGRVLGLNLEIPSSVDTLRGPAGGGASLKSVPDAMPVNPYADVRRGIPPGTGDSGRGECGAISPSFWVRPRRRNRLGMRSSTASKVYLKSETRGTFVRPPLVEWCVWSGIGVPGRDAPPERVGSALSFADRLRKRNSGTSQMQTPKNDATSAKVGLSVDTRGVCGRW